MYLFIYLLVYCLLPIALLAKKSTNRQQTWAKMAGTPQQCKSFTVGPYGLRR